MSSDVYFETEKLSLLRKKITDLCVENNCSTAPNVFLIMTHLPILYLSMNVVWMRAGVMGRLARKK